MNTCDDKLLFERESCLNCVMKHIGQARALMCETKKGYPTHVIFAMGHLAEAEDEALQMYPFVTEIIREERIALQDSLVLDKRYVIDFEDLLIKIFKIDEEMADEQLKEIRNA